MDKFDVVAAIIIKNDKYFIAQRNRNKHMGLSWEFPGGKVEKGETFEIALQREIKEELNIEINIKKEAKEKFIKLNFKPYNLPFLDIQEPTGHCKNNNKIN